jgi:hypothetical protein
MLFTCPSHQIHCCETVYSLILIAIITCSKARQLLCDAVGVDTVLRASSMFNILKSCICYPVSLQCCIHLRHLLSQHSDLQQIIVGVGLATPRPGIFKSVVKYLLVVSNTSELTSSILFSAYKRCD